MWTGPENRPENEIENKMETLIAFSETHQQVILLKGGLNWIHVMEWKMDWKMGRKT